jgi:hypothetical protein
MKYQQHNSDICREYFEAVLPDEDGNCSLCGAQLVGTAIVYSKITSYDPDEWEEIGQLEALNGYTSYLKSYANSMHFDINEPTKAKIIDLGNAKSFYEWLRSEI